jgi:hypothetical protein
MTNSEKWAWWTLGVAGLTAAAYFAFLALVGAGPAIISVFALLALTAVPSHSRRHLKGRALDEREKEIAGKALLAGFRALWVAFVAVVLTVGFAKGWDASVTLPLWRLEEILLWSAVLVLAVESVTTLVLYRRGSHA